MANLHVVIESEKDYVLDNFYSGSSIQLKLKKGEKAQDLASKWYKKDKNRHLEKQKLQENKNAKRVISNGYRKMRKDPALVDSRAGTLPR